MYSTVMNTHRNTLGAEVLTAKKARPTQPDSPVVELRKAMQDGKPVWVRNGRHRKRMLKVESKNGKAVSLVEPGRGPLTVTMYDTALTQSAYGRQTPQLGDLFNDVMAAVVPGWDQRPDWMKKIQVKPDPARLLQSATKLVPPAQVEKILSVGQQYGITPYYAGQPITPATGGFAWQAGGIGAAVAQVPGWVWLAGGGLVLILVMGMGRR